MGGSHSREGSLDSSDEEEEEEEEVEEEEEEEEEETEKGLHVVDTVKRFESAAEIGIKESLDSLSLNEKADSKTVVKKQENVNPESMKNKVKLYHHLGGKTPKARWVVADKLVNFVFVKEGEEEDEDDDDEDERKSKAKPEFRKWLLKVGNRVRARVDDRLQMKFFDDALRVDFVFQGVWAIKFLNQPEYFAFIAEFQNYMFENAYQLKATQENKMKVFGKEFMGWAKPEEADESIWDEYPSKDETLTKAKDLKETMAEASTGGIRSLTMGALDYSFLVSDAGIETFKNGYGGVKSRGISVQLGQGKSEPCTPQKGMLIRGESNMLLLSPAMDKSVHHSSGVHQLDLESGKVVAEWKFGKDGTPITMRDVTNDSKGAQLDPSLSTFLGLDDNRLCRWDMRVAQGIVQEIDSPHLSWAEGHQFSRGTNFQCFASSGDGCVVVGSRDGKIRLYGTSSMRQAKTAFPGLGSPITHVDVTFDGKWVLATTDTYLILISTMFKDKDGKTKTGFHGRMGNRIAAPRLLKLTPVDSHLAGKNHKFRGGQFSWVTEAGKEEHNMVVTVGSFTVLWNFNRVKQSDHECYKNATGLKSCYCYKIIPKEESIVDSKFMHDNFNQLRSPEAPIVVATPRKVSTFNF